MSHGRCEDAAMEQARVWFFQPTSAEVAQRRVEAVAKQLSTERR
jgi:hypothetical protein